MKTDRQPRHRYRARSEARLESPAELVSALQSEAVREAARLSGVRAARDASDLIPDAAPAELTDVTIGFDLQGRELRITTFVAGTSRAHLGTRALLAAQVAAAAIVERFSDSDTSFGEVRASIIERAGGLESLEYDFDPPIRAGVLVVSDGIASGGSGDRAGVLVRDAVGKLGRFGVEHDRDVVVRDDPESIRTRLEEWCGDGLELIFTVGGTGLAPGISAIEVVESMIDTPVPGLMEAVRDYGQEQNPLAFMSRGVAGLIGDALVVTLPGSTDAAREATEVMFPAVLHVCKRRRELQDRWRDSGA